MASATSIAQPSIATPQVLVITESAARKVHQLVQEEGNAELRLRVYIEGGGCSGFQYGFTFDDEVQADDIVLRKCFATTSQSADDEDDGGEQACVEFLVDPMSYQYLMGAEIDYQSDLEGERFIIRNPNATTTCGCGSSFSI